MDTLYIFITLPIPANRIICFVKMKLLIYGDLLQIICLFTRFKLKKNNLLLGKHPNLKEGSKINIIIRFKATTIFSVLKSL